MTEKARSCFLMAVFAVVLSLAPQMAFANAVDDDSLDGLQNDQGAVQIEGSADSATAEVDAEAVEEQAASAPESDAEADEATCQPEAAEETAATEAAVDGICDIDQGESEQASEKHDALDSPDTGDAPDVLDAADVPKTSETLNKPKPSETPAVSANAADARLSTQAPDAFSEGAYVIKAQTTYGNALSVGAARNTAAIKVEPVDGAYDQIFYFQLSKAGLYSIFSITSGLALDTSSADVRQASYTGSNHQLFEVRPIGDCYALVSKAGRALMVSGNAVKTSSYKSGALAQRFWLVEAPSVIPGVQVLYASGAPQSSMGVSGNSRTQGAACQASSYKGEEGQKALVSRSGTGYEIKPISSGMSFAPSGANVTQQSKSFGWKVEFANNGARRGLVWKDSSTGKAMQVSGSSVKMASFTGAVAQAFIPMLTSAVANGCYNIKNISGGTVLEVAAGSWANGANIQLFTSNGTGAQFFDIKGVGSGMFKVVNAMTGYALSAASSNAYQYSYTGSYDQLWVPVASKGGGLAWINASTGKALNAAAMSAGSNVSTVAANYGKAQSWTLVKGSYESDSVLQTAMRHVNNSYSQTSYQIMVDRYNCRTVVAEKSGGVWRPIYNWVCTPGAPSTPTVGGDYTVGIRGYSFDGALGGTPYTCYYYTQFWGDYLFHSIPYYQGTWIEQDSRLGQRLSHGCVRLATSNAKWIYDNIPYATHVYVYN